MGKESPAVIDIQAVLVHPDATKNTPPHTSSASSASSWSVAVPVGDDASSSSVPMWQQEKLGGKCCGCCCDYRRAVIILAIIRLVFRLPAPPLVVLLIRRKDVVLLCMTTWKNWKWPRRHPPPAGTGMRHFCSLWPSLGPLVPWWVPWDSTSGSYLSIWCDLLVSSIAMVGRYLRQQMVILVLPTTQSLLHWWWIVAHDWLLFFSLQFTWLLAQFSLNIVTWSIRCMKRDSRFFIAMSGLFGKTIFFHRRLCFRGSTR